jgi:hypothetical protein
MGVTADRIADHTRQFGETEAWTYKQVFEGVPVDHLHLLTVSTEDYWLEHRVRQMADSIDRIFGGGKHNIAEHRQATCEVAFENPIGSYWQRQGLRTH